MIFVGFKNGNNGRKWFRILHPFPWNHFHHLSICSCRNRRNNVFINKWMICLFINNIKKCNNLSGHLICRSAQINLVLLIYRIYFYYSSFSDYRRQLWCWVIVCSVRHATRSSSIKYLHLYGPGALIRVFSIYTWSHSYLRRRHVLVIIKYFAHVL